MHNSYSQYFVDCEIKPKFEKELVSLWPGWLGEENLHKLNEVTEKHWSRFNDFIRLISNKFKVEILDCESETISNAHDIENTLSTHEDSMEKTASQFSNYVLPELGCVVSEDWDYIYILFGISVTVQ